MKKLLIAIAGRLIGIDYNTLTTAEKSIVLLLIAHGYLKINEELHVIIGA